MAISCVQSKKFSTGTGPPWSVPFTSAVTGGNLLLAVIGTFGSRAATVTDNLGNLWQRAGDYQIGTASDLSIWYCLATVSGSCTLTAQMIAPNTVSTITILLAEYTNSTPQLPAYLGSVRATATSASPSPGTLTTTDGCLAVATYSQGQSAQTTPTVSSPFVVRQVEADGLTKEAVGLAETEGTGASLVPVWSLSGSVAWTSIAATFAVGGPTIPDPEPVPAPEPPATPAQDAAPQVSQSGRVVTLYAVQNGIVYVAPAGSGATWTAATNATGSTLATSGIVRSASNGQKVWFADGASYLYYDPSDNAMHAWTASAGSLPTDGSGNTPRLICNWRGSIVLSGLEQDPQNWFISALDDPTDWNYSPVPFVVTCAVAGNNSDLGLVGDVVTCLIPYSDDVLIFGADHSIWALQGHPNLGGAIQRVSDTIGMAFGNPWCRDPYGVLYFFSNQCGIYSMKPGEIPVRMSQPIEQFIRNVNTGKSIIRLQWDDSWQGFHVWITRPDVLSSCVHLFWEQRTGAWWTDTFRSRFQDPCCCVTFDGNSPQDRRALIGSFDGYVRTLDPDASNDDGVPIDSCVVLGPLLTRDLDEVLLKYLQAVLGASSATVSWAVHAGPTAEIALGESPVASGTWSAGRSYNTPVRRTGHALWLKLTASSQWALETIRASVSTTGKISQRSKG